MKGRFIHIIGYVTMVMAIPLMAAQPNRTTKPQQPSELDALIVQAEDENPAIQEARWKVEQALLKHQELREFLDPVFTVAAGHADNSKTVPGSRNYDATLNDATELTAGVDIPFSDGFYLTVGGAERVLHDRPDHAHMAQTLVGARIRIPLLKDRGFKVFELNQALARAEYNAAVSELLTQTQKVRRDVTLAYIEAYEAQMSYRTTQEASERFRKLVLEAIQLERLGVIPAYQIHDARMDYQIGLENEEIARNKVELKLISLAATTGRHRELRLQHENDEDFLLRLATLTPHVSGVNFKKACQARGSYLALENSVQQSRVHILAAQEDLKDDLNLNLGAAWQAESDTSPLGTHQLTGMERPGAEIAIVWSRTYDRRGPKARIARFNAQVRQFKERLRAEEVQIETEIRNALNNLTAAQNRLEIVSIGIEASEKSLQAEQERFKQGQATSSVVTDAQKDLTNLKQRRTTAAADLLRAHANLLYAIGYATRTSED